MARFFPSKKAKMVNIINHNIKSRALCFSTKTKTILKNKYNLQFSFFFLFLIVEYSLDHIFSYYECEFYGKNRNRINNNFEFFKKLLIFV
jgi:hypothetical protein